MGYNYYKLKHEGRYHRKMNLTADATLGYFNRKLKLLASVEYLKGKVCVPALQGSSDYGMDQWIVTLQESWLKNRLRAQLMYVPPIHLGVSKYQQERVSTDFYSMSRSLNLRTYDNMLFLRLTYTFRKGKPARHVEAGGIYDNESKQGRGLLGNE